jgi:hypothetical protein
MDGSRHKNWLEVVWLDTLWIEPLAVHNVLNPPYFISLRNYLENCKFVTYAPYTFIGIQESPFNSLFIIG